MQLRTYAALGFLLTVSALPALAQRNIGGSVRDSVTSEPVVAGAVVVKGTTIGTNIRPNGQFVLSGAPNGDVTLVFRSLGYFAKEVRVPSSTASVNVVLNRDVFKIEQVVITGQATTIERRSAPNAVATVDVQDLNVAPTASVEQQLVGKVAGADIQQNSGAPGGGIQVRLRGVTSVNADAQPLYVVDGVIMSDVAIPSNQNAVTNAAGGSNPALNQDAQVNRIADLNPNDIETIEILKGASAAAIYGGRASNGVILITTKRGRAGGIVVNFRQRGGFSQISNKVGSRRFNTAAEVDAAFGAGTAAANNFQPGVFFDNEDAMTEGSHPATETALSLSGGNDNTQYFASGLLQREKGVVIGTGADKQSLRLNLDQRIGGTLQANLTTFVAHNKAQRGLTNNDNTGTSYWLALSFTPSFVDLRRKADGTFPNNPFTSSNPVQTASLSKNDEDVYRFTPGLRVSWAAWSNATQALTLNGLAAADYFTQKNALFFPPELQFEPQDGFPGTSLLTNSDNLNLNGDFTVNHSWNPGGFSAGTSLGVQRVRRQLDISRIVARNLVGGQSNVDAGTNVQVREQRQLVNDMGIFAQEQIQMLAERLTISLGIRADQSSLDADASKLYYFPKGALSYRFSNLSWVDELKLRAAWGQSGNQPLYGQRFTPLTANTNINGLPGLVNGGTTGSTTLGPERQTEIEGGVDAALFRGRANVEASVYQKKITDLLLTRALPQSSGFNFEIFNGGALRTRGVELALGLVPVQTSAINWLFRTTFSANRAIITELPVPTFQTGGFGVALGSFQIERGKSATQIVGNDTIGGETVVRKLGDANPKFRMSFSNDITWRNFGARGLLEWQNGSTIINLTKLLSDFGQVTKDYADPIPGTDETVGQRRLRGFGTVTRNVLESGSYVKLREVSVYYELPRSMLQRVWGGARSARVTFAGRNLFASFPYTGLDPEVSNFGNQAIARNIDVAPYPPSRQYYLTIDLGF